jgi:hypothetical protein
VQDVKNDDIRHRRRCDRKVCQDERDVDVIAVLRREWRRSSNLGIPLGSWNLGSMYAYMDIWTLGCRTLRDSWQLAVVNRAKASLHKGFPQKRRAAERLASFVGGAEGRLLYGGWLSQG